MAWLRSVVGEAANNDRLLVVSFAVLVVELSARAVLAWEFSSLLVVLWPPVLGIVVFGLAAVRSGTAGRESVRGDGGWLRLTGTLAAIAIAGHAVSLVLGAALFFLVDTPLRAFAYWLGLDLVEWPFVYLGLPLIGLALGVAVAWVLPATIAADVSRGTPLTRAVRRTVLGLTRAPRLFDWIAFALLVVATSVVVSAMAAAWVLDWVGVSSYLAPSFDIGSLGAYFLLALGIAVLLGTVPLAVATRAAVSALRKLDEHALSRSETESAVTRNVTTLAVVLVLVVGLGAGAGAARTAELRPVDDPALEPLTDNPRLMTIAAKENTVLQSFQVDEYRLIEDRSEPYRTSSVNYRTRELVDLRSPFDTYGRSDKYIWAGLRSGDPRSPTEYLLRVDRSDGFASVPAIRWDTIDLVPLHRILSLPDPGQNATVEHRDDRIVIETTDVEHIVSEHERYLNPPDRITGADEAWMRIEIDPGTRTLREVEYAYNVTYAYDHEAEEERKTVHRRYEIDLDPTVDRPDGEGPTLEEQVWRLLLY